MRIEILSRSTQAGFDNQHLVEHHVGQRLDRFSDDIAGLRVSVVDLNGPKGGVDRDVRVEATLVDGGALRVHARAALIPAAVDRAMRRLSRLLPHSARAKPRKGAVSRCTSSTRAMIRPADFSSRSSFAMVRDNSGSSSSSQVSATRPISSTAPSRGCARSGCS